MAKTYYAPSHEYITVDGNIGYIGISEFAAKELGNVTYVDMPEADDEFEAGEDFGAIESRKAASDLFAPVDIKVLDINDALEADPTLINRDPLNNWIIKVEISDPTQLDSLMDEKAYADFTAAEK